MKLYDENGDYVGEFVKNSISDVKDSAIESINDGSLGWGLILLLIIFPGWTILCVTIYLIIKFIWAILKLSFCILFWLIRLPFKLIFWREFPKFWFYKQD